ncbi:MAG: TraB/GumN family protein [Anaerofustis sp.]
MNENVTELNVGTKTIYLLGTAHVSKESADEAYELIREIRPDSVCIELDRERINNINNRDQWNDQDIITVIKQKKSAFLLVNVILSSYQKRIAEQFGVQPGQEMINSMAAAKEVGARIIPVDRSIRTTFMRIWRKLKFWDKMKLIFNVTFSFFDDTELTDADLENLKTQDMLESALSELGKSFPSLKTYLVDERDIYLSQKIKQAPGSVIVAVVGAAHTPGIKEYIKQDFDVKEYDIIPPASSALKIVGWAIPILIIGMIVLTFVFDSASAGWDQIRRLILYCGTFSAIGTLLAGGHILSILTAFVAAPFTAINPVLAAGWFAGLTEAAIRKPKVEDFNRLSEDLSSLKGLWKNKLTKVLLVVTLANIGSAIGTWTSGIDIFVKLKDIF